MNNKIDLLPGEQIVLSAYDNILVLTTKRVRYDSVVWGRSELISITLSSVASCGLVTTSYPLLLLFAIIAFVAAFAPIFKLIPPNDATGVLIGVAIVLVILYFTTRGSVISIASNGGKVIKVPTKGMKRDAIVTFIDALEREKLM